MSTDISRRDFMKAAGVGAGFMIASGYSPFSYAANEKVRIGCIGTGGQGTYHIREGLAGTEAIDLVAVCDVFHPHQRSAQLYGRIANAGIKMGPGESPNDLPAEARAKIRDARTPKGYYDYKEMLAEEELDAVVISTPLTSHYQISMDCLDAGKWVFCEKTLVDSVEEGQSLLRKCHETGKFLQVGHQRRYNPRYNLAMSIARDEGLLGRINHITAQWHRNNYWRRAWQLEYPDYELNDEEKKYISDLEQHLNWRMYDELSGGLYFELATHQTDIANWFLMAVPARVHAFGGVDYWRDGRTVDDNIVLSYEYELRPQDPGFQTLDARSQLQRLPLLNRSYGVRFMYSSILANAKRGASELIQGDWATLELTEHDCFMYGESAPVAEAEARVAAAQAAREGADGDSPVSTITSGESLQLSNEELTEGRKLLGDRELNSANHYQFEAFAHHIRNGGIPRNNQMVGYTTSLTAIAAMESRRSGKVVEIDPAWYNLDFETPSFYDWHWDAEAYPEA